MDLYQEMFVKQFQNLGDDAILPALKIDVTKIIQSECCRALEEIKAILEKDCLDDKTCFFRIEEIVCLFEKMGSSCGGRHDFG